MRNDSRAFLVSAAIAGLLGAISVPIAATDPITTEPVPPVTTSEPVLPTTTPQEVSTPATTPVSTTTAKAPLTASTTTPPVPTTTPPISTTTSPPTSTATPLPSSGPSSVTPESSAVLPAPTLDAPATARRGTVITVHGENWPCDMVRAFPDWAESVTAQVQGGSFDARVGVPDRAELGSQSLPVTCLGTFQRIVARTSVEILSAPVVTTTTDGPTTSTDAPSTTAPTSGRPTTAQQVDDRSQETGLGDMLGLGGFLLALAAALLLARGLRKSQSGRSRAPNGDPHPPQVHVRVVVDSAPSIHIRQVVRAPAVRVRLRAGEPWLHVEEVLG